MLLDQKYLLGKMAEVQDNSARPKILSGVQAGIWYVLTLRSKLWRSKYCTRFDIGDLEEGY